MTIRPLRAVLMLGAAALMVAGCTGGSTPSGPPETAPPSATAAELNPAIPSYNVDRAKAYAVLRKIDACGMFDVDATAKVSGATADEILPSNDGLVGCVLRMTKGEFHSSWSLNLEVGATFDSTIRENSAPQTVAGRKVYTEEGDSGGSCVLHRPLDDVLAPLPTGGDYAIDLRVRAGSKEESQAKNACVFAREVLEASAPLWTDPPRRGSGRTTPELPLAVLDPCDAAAAMLEEYGEGAELTPVTPSRCVAKTARGGKAGKGGTGKAVTPGETTVEFEMDEDPLKLIGIKVTSAEHTALDVGSYKGVVRKSKGNCLTRMIWDPDTKVIANARIENPPVSYQVVSVTTKTCEQAEAAVEKVLAKVGKP